MQHRWKWLQLFSVAIVALTLEGAWAQPKAEKKVDAPTVKADEPAAKKEAPAKKADEAAAKKPAAAVDKPNEKILEKLREQVNVSRQATPLREVVEKLAEEQEVQLRFDDEAIKRAGIDDQVKITVSLRKFTLEAALQRVLRRYGLHHEVEQGTLVIRPAPAQRRRAAVKVQAAEQAVAMAAAVDAQAQQYEQYLRPSLQSELRFAGKVCGVNREQWQKLRAAGDPLLKEAAREFVRFQQGNMRARANNGGPYEVIRKGVADWVTQHLTPEQAKLLEEESVLRSAHNREMAIDNFVARVDRDLVLSTEQRAAITAELKKVWTEEWCWSPETFTNGSEYILHIPDAHIVPHLQPAQKTVWQGLPKISGMNFWGFSNFGEAADDDEWDSDLSGGAAAPQEGGR